jgi:hypothetical protein
VLDVRAVLAASRELKLECQRVHDLVQILLGIQKAVMAGVAVAAAVPAPSSLAIDLARVANVTLLGFVRGAAFNIYAHPQRVHLAEPDRPYVS